MLSTVYKIRRKSDGKFSTGGCDPSWSRNGKAWATRALLRSHLTMVADNGPHKVRSWEDPSPKNDENRMKNLMAVYHDAEVIVFDVRPSLIQTVEQFRNTK